MLRLLNKTDLPEVVNIELLTQFAPWTQETFERCWEAGFQGWVVEVDAKVIGFIIASFQAGEAHILNLCVHPDFQRQGFGKKLMMLSLSRAKTRQLNMAYLEVRRSNTKAISIYEKMGFIQIGERKEYYPASKGREDALIFALDLTTFNDTMS